MGERSTVKVFVVRNETKAGLCSPEIFECFLSRDSPAGTPIRRYIVEKGGVSPVLDRDHPLVTHFETLFETVCSHLKLFDTFRIA